MVFLDRGQLYEGMTRDRLLYLVCCVEAWLHGVECCILETSSTRSMESPSKGGASIRLLHSWYVRGLGDEWSYHLAIFSFSKR